MLPADFPRRIGPGLLENQRKLDARVLLAQLPSILENELKEHLLAGTERRMPREHVNREQRRANALFDLGKSNVESPHEGLRYGQHACPQVSQHLASATGRCEVGLI